MSLKDREQIRALAICALAAEACVACQWKSGYQTSAVPLTSDGLGALPPPLLPTLIPFVGYPLVFHLLGEVCTHLTQRVRNVGCRVLRMVRKGQNDCPYPLGGCDVICF